MNTELEYNPLSTAGTPYWWYNDESKQMLSNGYLQQGETVEDAIDRICTSASRQLYRPELKNIFKEMIIKGWISFSSPVWANMGTNRGLPISCFNVYVPDDMIGISDKISEIILQTKTGGGTSGYYGDVRPRGSKITGNGRATGAVSFMNIVDTVMGNVSQGEVRKGAFCSYLPIDHGDIDEFLQIRSIGSPIQNLFTGVCVPDYWMQEMIDGDESKRAVWAKVLKSRKETGMPFIVFSDTVNNNKPEVYKKHSLTINGSNLCSEIMLPSTENESFVCCLASMNLELWDEWKDTDAVYYTTFFLDAVMEEFIRNSKGMRHLENARRFAKRHRALGLGALGYHSYLQKNNIPFESMEAKMFNARVFKHIQDQSKRASADLATIYGEPELLKGTGLRNTTTMAIAPNTSSSSILGQTSPGIEPFASNYYKAGLAKGNFMRKNKYLKKLLEEKGKDTEEVWRDIMLSDGSVQHLDFLTDVEKSIFKTFKEIAPIEIITQAGQRQQYIDQAQSLNLNIPPDVPIKDVNALLIEAWKVGVKTLYYQRSSSVSKLVSQQFTAVCSSCEA